MRMAMWDKLKTRGRVDDRRGMAAGVGGLSITGVLLLMAVNYFLGGDVTDVLNQIQQAPPALQHQEDQGQFAGEDEYERFASTVLGSNNQMWSALFTENNRAYQEPTLVLFRSATPSDCGMATSQVGPHYCPLDNTIYLDETFFDELTTRLGAQGGDVAEAYVISHEVGHHIQNELGTMEQVRNEQQRNPQRANDLSIALELQADCYAGLWANYVREFNIFEPGEIQEAMDAASTVGDDRIQEKVSGQINPESWTHGSSQQRVGAFTRGYESGSLSACEL